MFGMTKPRFHNKGVPLHLKTMYFLSHFVVVLLSIFYVHVLYTSCIAIKLLLELGNKAFVKIKLTNLRPSVGAVLPAAIGPIVGLDDALICKIK